MAQNQSKKSPRSKGTSKILIFLIASLTLGLAPFTPEPHIVGKLEWLLGGAVGMQAMDWFDLVLHGTPWVLLIGSLLWQFKQRVTIR